MTGSSCDDRHRAYRAMARALRVDPTLPVAVRAIRFFDAAALVTAPNGIGLLLRSEGGLAQRLCRRIAGDDCIDLLEAISADLFARNVAVFERLTRDRGEPRCPLSGRGPLAAAAFDRAMVVFEQRAVDDLLAHRPPAPATRVGIDRLLAWCASPLVGRLAGLDDDLVGAVGATRRRHGDGFLSIGTRIAIGQGIVDRLHGVASGG